MGRLGYHVHHSDLSRHVLRCRMLEEAESPTQAARYHMASHVAWCRMFHLESILKHVEFWIIFESFWSRFFLLAVLFLNLGFLSGGPSYVGLGLVAAEAWRWAWEHWDKDEIERCLVQKRSIQVTIFWPPLTTLPMFEFLRGFWSVIGQITTEKTSHFELLPVWTLILM